MIAQIKNKLPEHARFSQVIGPFMTRGRGALGKPSRNCAILDVGPFEFPTFPVRKEFEFKFVLTRSDGFSMRGKLANLAANPRSSWWRSYLGFVAKSFSEAFDGRSCQVKFSRVSSNMCTLFHTDNVHVRLFQTIEGPGTQYLLEENVRREGIGHGSNENIIIDPRKIQHVKSGHILLMRGRRWHEDRAFVHRSPPIEDSGSSRLCLCIDIDDP